MPTVRLEGLIKTYGNIKAADGLDLEVKDGEYLCLLGPTGAGKTTALRMISGLLAPDKGEVTLRLGEQIFHTPYQDTAACFDEQIKPAIAAQSDA